MARRGVARFVLVVAVVVSAGCTGFVLGSEPLEFDSSPASVSDSALAEAGFELRDAQEQRFDETFELAGAERRVIVTSHMASYGTAEDAAVPSVAFVMSTPRASAFGQSLNPLAHAPTEELLERAFAESDEFQEFRAVGNRSVDTLGETVEATTFRAVPTNESAPDTIVHVVRVEHGDDLVFAVVAYPEGSPDGESDAMTIFRGLRH